MNIYIASSWKNSQDVIKLKNLLVERSHSVDAFCDFDDKDRFVFDFKEIPNWEDYNAISFLTLDRVQKAYVQDKEMIEWCDCLILLLPSGKSSHLEAGYAKGLGKRVAIIGDFPKGEIDVMYGLADKMFVVNPEGMADLLQWLRWQ